MHVSNAQENEYPGGIFVPMYDQSGAQVPVSTQQSEPNSATTDYRRNCGVPLAFFEPQSTSKFEFTSNAVAFYSI